MNEYEHLGGHMKKVIPAELYGSYYTFIGQSCDLKAQPQYCELFSTRQVKLLLRIRL